MSEMIERVANAIWRTFDALPSPSSRDLAVAAITAMREPSLAMLNTAWTFEPSDSDLWRAMIDAALREPGETP